MCKFVGKEDGGVDWRAIWDIFALFIAIKGCNTVYAVLLLGTRPASLTH